MCIVENHKSKYFLLFQEKKKFFSDKNVGGCLSIKILNSFNLSRGKLFYRKYDQVIYY